MKNVLVITNFNAGRKQVIRYKKDVLDFLIKRCKMFKFAEIDELNNIDIRPFDTVITMGGDGTINKVLPYIINTEKVLGIIPLGTANLLAAKLGITLNIKKSLKIIEKSNIKAIDILNINENLCALRFGIGYDADIITKTPQSVKNKFGYFSYFIAGVLFALRLKRKTYEITAENNTFKEDASCIIIANAANMYRNIISVGQNSATDDGLADIFILKPTNPIIFFIEFLKIIFNIKKNNKNTVYMKASKISIKNTWLFCHIDGEKKKIRGDIKINILPKTLKVYST
ncbi:MAG: diacylglycerol/lipid kinase family protein [Candidatus Avigastranaerophilus sp.]